MIKQMIIATLLLFTASLLPMEKEGESSTNELSHKVSSLQLAIEEQPNPSFNQENRNSDEQLPAAQVTSYLHLLPKELLALLFLYASFSHNYKIDENYWNPKDPSQVHLLEITSKSLALQIRKNFKKTISTLKHYLSFDPNYTESPQLYDELITKIVNTFSSQQIDFIKKLLISHQLGNLHLAVGLVNQKNKGFPIIENKIENYCKENKLDIVTLSFPVYKQIENYLHSKDKEFNKICEELKVMMQPDPASYINKNFTNDNAAKSVASEIYEIHSSVIDCLDTTQLYKNPTLPSYKKEILKDFFLHIANRLYTAAYLGTPQALLLVEAYLKQQSDKALNTDSTALGAHKDAKTFSEFIRTSLATDCLCIAAQTNNIPLAELACNYGATIKGRLYPTQFKQAILNIENDGYTIIAEGLHYSCPLALASIYGHRTILEFLIAKGAHKESQEVALPDLIFSIIAALNNKQTETSKFLLSYVEKINPVNLSLISNAARYLENNEAEAIIKLAHSKKLTPLTNV